MISKAVQDGINQQICNELTAAYLYLAMVAWFEERNFHGMASWMQFQTREEVEHGMRLFAFLLERGGSVQLDAIGKPNVDFETPLECFKAALAHEQKVTREINNLYELALNEKDYATQIQLQWFITEQVEEEDSTSEIVERLEMIGDDPTGLLMVDQQLGQRQVSEEGGEGGE